MGGYVVLVVSAVETKNSAHWDRVVAEGEHLTAVHRDVLARKDVQPMSWMDIMCSVYLADLVDPPRTALEPDKVDTVKVLEGVQTVLALNIG
jgi:hypothetical protein